MTLERKDERTLIFRRNPNMLGQQPQVVGRIWNMTEALDDGKQGTAHLNSVGRGLPDDTPLYALVPIPADYQSPTRLGYAHVESARVNAKMWLDGAREYKNANPSAVLAAEQAVNAYKNCAYHLAEELERARQLLDRCKTILGNMALENPKQSLIDRLAKSRWPISHEPLRADAKNILP